MTVQRAKNHEIAVRFAQKPYRRHTVWGIKVVIRPQQTHHKLYVTMALTRYEMTNSSQGTY